MNLNWQVLNRASRILIKGENNGILYEKTDLPKMRRNGTIRHMGKGSDRNVKRYSKFF